MTHWPTSSHTDERLFCFLYMTDATDISDSLITQTIDKAEKLIADGEVSDVFCNLAEKFVVYFSVRAKHEQTRRCSKKESFNKFRGLLRRITKLRQFLSLFFLCATQKGN